MINAIHIADHTTFGVGERVYVPQHQQPRQIVAVFMGTKEPFYTFHDGYGIKGWSETTLLALNPSAGIMLQETAATPEIKPLSPVIADLASTHANSAQQGLNRVLSGFNGNPASSVNVALLYPIVLVDFWLPAVSVAADPEPDTAALDDAAIEVTEALTYIPEDAELVVERHKDIGFLSIPADLLPLTTIQVTGDQLEAGDVMAHWHGADFLPRTITKLIGGYGFYDYTRNGETVEHAFPIYTSVGLYALCGGRKFEAAKADRALVKRNAAGQWVWVGTREAVLS